MSIQIQERTPNKKLGVRTKRCRVSSRLRIRPPARRRKTRALNECRAAQPTVEPRETAAHSPRRELQGMARADDSVWTIVLAGGEGERLRPLMERWLGAHRPKQYCAFVGRRSMLRHTLDRAELFSGAEHMRIIVAKHHEPHIWDRLEDQHAEAIIAQPQNRGTAAGVFLPMTHIGAKDPGATLVILPSDHFVHPEGVFLDAVRRAIQAAQCLPDKLILLGASPDRPETEYGWIQPGNVVGHIDGFPVREVAGFQEKPAVHEARRLMQAGGIWNTMVIAAQWKTLWDLGWRCFPDLMAGFEEFAIHLGTRREQSFLQRLYERLPCQNFSSGLLQKVPDASVVMELRGAMWSDWGHETRILETLRKIGKMPSFAAVSPVQASIAL